MARSKLLGCHWFMGKTGFDNLRKESDEAIEKVELEKTEENQ